MENNVEEVGNYSFPPYPEMVKNLFKIDIPGNRADLMHAAIGIGGEAVEILGATDRINLFEEFGDIEFYIEALKQRGLEHGYDFSKSGMWASDFAPLNAQGYLLIIALAGGSILDLMKKCWIYNDREPKVLEVACHLAVLENALAYAYNLHNVSREDILYGNQVKLIGKDGRYRTGKYSDEQALARADKASQTGVMDLTKAPPQWPYEANNDLLQAGTMEGFPKVKVGTIDPDLLHVPSAEGQPEGTGQIVVDGEVKTYALTEVNLDKQD